MYFAVRSPRLGAPALICPAFVATAISAIATSSVSPLRWETIAPYRFRCASDECTSTHDLVVLDWELNTLARATRERYGAQWATQFRESWGAGLTERFDVHLLLSAYAQAPSKLYIAGLFYPPKSAEDQHEHRHHVAHRAHAS